jgi:hypothetical protein
LGDFRVLQVLALINSGLLGKSAAALELLTTLSDANVRESRRNLSRNSTRARVIW